MNVQETNYFLSLDKFIIDKGNKLETYETTISDHVNIKWKLISPSDPDQEFLVDIKESEKKILSISLHHQHDGTKEGLLRIDFHSRHRNPDQVLNSVPNNFKQYAGIYLDEYNGHVHYNVDGYLPLLWAIPIEVDPFPVKDVSNIGHIADAIIAFGNVINVKTELKISSQMRII